MVLVFLSSSIVAMGAPGALAARQQVAQAFVKAASVNASTCARVANGDPCSFTGVDVEVYRPAFDWADAPSGACVFLDHIEGRRSGSGLISVADFYGRSCVDIHATLPASLAWGRLTAVVPIQMCPRGGTCVDHGYATIDLTWDGTMQEYFSPPRTVRYENSEDGSPCLMHEGRVRVMDAHVSGSISEFGDIGTTHGPSGATLYRVPAIFVGSNVNGCID
jgi:hypothetical protein